MSKQSSPAPTASIVGLCPTIIQMSKTPSALKVTQRQRPIITHILWLGVLTKCARACVKWRLLTLLHSERPCAIVYNFGLSECNIVVILLPKSPFVRHGRRETKIEILLLSAI